MNTKNLKPFDLQAALMGEPVMSRDGSKEDAIANAKAMLGINPYEESEE